MPLLFATRDGVYRTETIPFSDPERVLNSGDTIRVRTFPGVNGVFATSKTGLYHSSDGRQWRNLDVPAEEVWEVLVHDGELYAGGYPGAIYRSADNGNSWSNCRGCRKFRTG